MKIVKNIQKLSHEIVVYAKDGRKSHLTLHWSAENVKIDKTNFSLRNTIPLHGMNKTNDERCYTAAVWTQISIPPLQVCGALSGGWVGCLCQWELKAPTDRSRSDCVHEQVAKRIANVRFTYLEFFRLQKNTAPAGNHTFLPERCFYVLIFTILCYSDHTSKIISP